MEQHDSLKRFAEKVICAGNGCQLQDFGMSRGYEDGLTFVWSKFLNFLHISAPEISPEVRINDAEISNNANLWKRDFAIGIKCYTIIAKALNQ